MNKTKFLFVLIKRIKSSLNITVLWCGFCCLLLIFIFPITFNFTLAAESLNPENNPGELEIFSWWTAPGEEQGLQYLMDSFQKEYPHINVVNAAVEGGAGINAKDVLKIRLLRDRPPDTFQVHGGAELKDTFIAGDYLSPITDLWQAQGWRESFFSEIAEMVEVEGEYYSLPVTIHRANRLWYNQNIFSKHDISPPGTPRELVETAEQLAEKDITPLALSSRNLWPTTHLFETLLAAVATAEEYNSLVTGEKSWQSPPVEETLKYLQEILAYVNPDHAGLNWHQACERVLEEKAAMTVMGTWARGFFNARGAEKGEDYGAAVINSEQPVFLLVVDTFALPAEAAQSEYTYRWLEQAAEPRVQKKFTEILGAVPPHKDIAVEELTPGIAEDRKDLQRSQLVPSLVHGAAAREVFISALNEELNVFLYENEIFETMKELENLAEIYLR